jgi:hypothetical protein
MEQQPSPGDAEEPRVPGAAAALLVEKGLTWDPKMTPGHALVRGLATIAEHGGAKRAPFEERLEDETVAERLAELADGKLGDREDVKEILRAVDEGVIELGLRDRLAKSDAEAAQRRPAIEVSPEETRRIADDRTRRALLEAKYDEAANAPEAMVNVATGRLEQVRDADHFTVSSPMKAVLVEEHRRQTRRNVVAEVTPDAARDIARGFVRDRDEAERESRSLRSALSRRYDELATEEREAPPPATPLPENRRGALEQAWSAANPSDSGSEESSSPAEAGTP